MSNWDVYGCMGNHELTRAANPSKFPPKYAYTLFSYIYLLPYAIKCLKAHKDLLNPCKLSLASISEAAFAVIIERRRSPNDRSSHV